MKIPSRAGGQLPTSEITVLQIPRDSDRSIQVVLFRFQIAYESIFSTAENVRVENYRLRGRTIEDRQKELLVETINRLSKDTESIIFGRFKYESCALRRESRYDSPLIWVEMREEIETTSVFRVVHTYTYARRIIFYKMRVHGPRSIGTMIAKEIMIGREFRFNRFSSSLDECFYDLCTRLHVLFDEVDWRDGELVSWNST